jgi:hypothetical protein
VHTVLLVLVRASHGHSHGPTQKGFALCSRRIPRTSLFTHTPLIPFIHTSLPLPQHTHTHTSFTLHPPSLIPHSLFHNTHTHTYTSFTLHPPSLTPHSSTTHTHTHSLFTHSLYSLLTHTPPAHMLCCFLARTLSVIMLPSHAAMLPPVLSFCWWNLNLNPDMALCL